MLRCLRSAPHPCPGRLPTAALPVPPWAATATAAEGPLIPDTVPEVIHDAAERPCGRRRSGIVDNSAGARRPVVNKLSRSRGASGTPVMLSPPAVGHRVSVHVTPRPRSEIQPLTKRNRRSPDRGETPVETSERTSPQGRAVPRRRGPRIRSTHNGPLTCERGGGPFSPAGAFTVSETDTSNSACDSAAFPARFTHFGGFDWARRSDHQLVVVDPAGRVVLSLRFADDAAGWAGLRERVAAFPALAVAIETSCGPAVERLLDLGLEVYPMNPKAAERHRDRKAPAGAKDD